MHEMFKGKSALDGSWVEGFHVSEQKDGNAVHYILMYDGTGFTWKLIDTETLSKCTGAKDRNKNLIWENDIIKFDDKLFIVEYDERFAMHVLRNTFSGVVANGMCFALSHCQVVGNRFDNMDMINTQLISDICDKDNIENLVIERISKVMEKKGISKSVLAERLGWNLSKISKIFHYRQGLTLSEAIIMAEVIDCDLAQLIQLEFDVKKL